MDNKLYTPLNINLSGFNRKYFWIGNFRIRPITKKEIEYFFGSIEVFCNENGFASGHRFSNPGQISFETDHKLWTLTACSKYLIESPDYDYFKKYYKTLIFAFKIFKEGKFICPATFTKRTFKTRTIYSFPGEIHYLIDTIDCKIYSTEFKDIKYLKKIYTQLTNILTQKNNRAEILSRIVERYLIAVDSETSKKNSFIDFVGIIETLLLSNDKDELRFRFSLIVSYILNNIYGFEIGFNEIRELYDIRSSLSHSSSTKKYSLDKFFLLYKIVRLIILWSIDNFDSEAGFNEVLNKLKIPKSTGA